MEYCHYAHTFEHTANNMAPAIKTPFDPLSLSQFIDVYMWTFRTYQTFVCRLNMSEILWPEQLPGIYGRNERAIELSTHIPIFFLQLVLLVGSSSCSKPYINVLSVYF